MRATVTVSKGETIITTQRQAIEWHFSLWFVMLSPLLGILLGMLALFVFAV